MVATAGIQAWEGGPRPDGGHSGRGEKQLERLRLCFEVGRLELLMDWVWSMRRVDADTNIIDLIFEALATDWLLPPLEQTIKSTI